MENEIKEILDYYDMEQKKKELEDYRIKLFKNEREMAHLTFNRLVGLYAFNLDKYLDLVDLYFLEKDEVKKKKYQNDIDKIIDILDSLEDEEGVKKYIHLRMENVSIRRKMNSYYVYLNTIIRNRIKEFELPEIYVKSGKNEYKHIIDENKIINNIEDAEIVINPYIEIDALRRYRHFYNKTSFNYLEGVTKDLNFDLEGKKLGNVKVKALK